MGRVASWLLVVAFAVACWPAGAIEYEPLTTDDGTRFIVIHGEFKSTDSISDFVAAVTAHRPRIVTFDSPGGNLWSAMQHGRMIRALGLNTLQLRQYECASACAFAFLGGVVRWAAPGSLGVHRSHFGPEAPFNREVAVEAIQQITADVMAYLREMDVDQELLEVALQYDSSDIRYLSNSEMERMRVITTFVEQPHDLQEGRTSPPSASRERPPAAQPPPPDLRPAARDFVMRIIDAHQGSEEAAIAKVRSSYSDSVNYFGTTTPLGEIISDKRNYFQRWPERAYQVRPEGLTVTCGPTICQVTGYYDWAVRSYARNRQAAGRASFEFRVDVSGHAMRVIGENSTVVERFRPQ